MAMPKTVGDPNWQPLINTPEFPGVHLGPCDLQRGGGPHPQALLQNGPGDLHRHLHQSASHPEDADIHPSLRCGG